MSKFKDAEGKDWDLRITVGHLRPLREDFGIDLRAALKEDDTTFAEAVGDPEKLGQILWVLLGPQAEKAGITPETFVMRFDGETVERAAVALVEAIVGFFRPGAGEKVGVALRKGQTYLRTKVATGLDRLTDAEIERGVDRALASMTSKSGALNSAALSASTPGPSPSEN